MHPSDESPAVLFDLDGTLLDTIEGIAAAANAVLRHYGFPEHPLPPFRHFVGDGADVLLERVVPPGVPVPPDALTRFADAYAAAWRAGTRVYPGIPDLLAEIASRGVPFAVCSNKPQAATEACVEALFPGIAFTDVWGRRPDLPKKPDPQVALALAERMGVTPAACRFLGDTSVDMRTARAAHMIPLGAAWGFRDREELVEHGAAAVLEHPLELLDWL